MKRLWFIPEWTIERWKKSSKFGNSQDSHMIHNILDNLAMDGHCAFVIGEEDGGLAFNEVDMGAQILQHERAEQ